MVSGFFCQSLVISKRHKQGFTFLEIIIAMTVLLIGILGLVSLFPVGLRASSRAVNLTKATFLARTVLEEIKRDGYDVLLPSPGNRDSAESADYPNFFYEVAWSYVPDETNLISVTVTVSWSEAGRPQSRNFITYITR